MRTSVQLLQEIVTYLDKVDDNLRCFSAMHCDNSPDSVLSQLLLDDVDTLSSLFSGLISYYNNSNN